MNLGPLAADADEARRRAEEILADDRFQPADYPRPLEGFFRWLGRLLRPIFEPVGRFLGDLLPGSGFIGWTLLAAAILILASLFALRLGRHRARSIERSEWIGNGAKEDPSRLEKDAEAAERSGDLEAAIRLRFKAGLLRLADAGAIRWRPSLTSGYVRRVLRSQVFDDVSSSFDAVAYGRRAPTPADVELSRRGWNAVLHEVRG